MSDVLARLRKALAGRYLIENEAGRGGMATVYRARDLKHGRFVAIKVLHPELATSVGSERFLHEIQTAAQLNHPHILALYDSGEADGLLYYIMPYVEGESLRERLEREGRLPIPDAVRIALQVAEALAYAHARGVIHRDIKPENILLVNPTHANVSDFGLARALFSASNRRLTATGLTVGSPLYMSPEQIGSEHAIDGRTDVYSLGCVLFEMLAGIPPFEGRTMQALLGQHMIALPPSLRAHRPEVTADLAQVVQRAMAKSPAERFTGAQSLARALKPRPKRIRSPMGLTISVERGRRNRFVPLAIGITAGVLLVPLFAVSVPRFAQYWSTAAPPGINVVVMPIAGSETATDSESSTALHQILLNGLEIVPGIRSVNGASVIEAGRSWRSHPIHSLIAAADNLSGRYLVLVELIPETPARVTVDLYDVRRGERLLRGVGGGGEETITLAIQRLALNMVRAIAEHERTDLKSVRRLLMATSSPTALAELMQARDLLWKGETDAAVAGFQRAIDADPEFAPAYFYLSTAEIWPPRWNYDAALAVLDDGLARSARMPVLWVSLLEAQRHYVLREADHAVWSFHQLISQDPDFAEAWFGLGESHFHLSGFSGSGPVSSLPAFERLISIDSGFAPLFTYSHLVDAAVWAGDAGKARRYATRIESEADRRAREAVLALRFGGPVEHARAFQTLRSEDSKVIAQLVYLTANEPHLMDSVAGALFHAERPMPDRRVGGRFRFAALAATGRWEEGIEVWRSTVYPAPLDAWMIHAYLAGYPADNLVTPMFAWARIIADSAGPLDFTILQSERTDAVRALVNRALVMGNTSDVDWLLERLGNATAGRTDPEPEGLRLSLLARRSLLAGDTTRAIELLEQALTRGPWSIDSYYRPLSDAAPQRLLLAQLHAQRGASDRARVWTNSFGNILAVGDVLFIPAANAIAQELQADPP